MKIEEFIIITHGIYVTRFDVQTQRKSCRKSNFGGFSFRFQIKVAFYHPSKYTFCHSLHLFPKENDNRERCEIRKENKLSELKIF